MSWNHCQGGKTWPVIENLVEAEYRQIWALKISWISSYMVVPPTLWALSPEPQPDFHSNIGEEKTNKQKKTNIVLLIRGNKKEPFLQYTRAFYSYNMVFPLEKLFNQNITCWGFIRVELAWKKGDTKLHQSQSSTKEKRNTYFSPTLAFYMG